MLSVAKTLKTVVKTSRVPLDQFCSNLQGLCKKVLSSKPRELFCKKNYSFIYKKLMKKKHVNRDSHIASLPISRSSFF